MPEQSPEAVSFLDDIIEVYKKHNMAISHEDGGGSFLIVPYDKSYEEWVRESPDLTIEKPFLKTD